jgi:hypothetical protein
MEGVHEGAEVGEAGGEVREGMHVEPGKQEKTGANVGLEEEAQVLEGALPARTAVPVWVGQQGRVGGWRTVGDEGGALQRDEGGHTHDQFPPALDRMLVRDPIIGPAELVLGLLEALFDPGPPAVRVAHLLFDLARQVARDVPRRLGGLVDRVGRDLEQALAIARAPPKDDLANEPGALVPSAKWRSKVCQRLERLCSPGGIQTTWLERIATT